MRTDDGQKTLATTPLLLVGALLIGALLGGAAWALRFLPSPVVVPSWLLAVPLGAGLLVVLLMRVGRHPPGLGQLLLGVPMLALVVGLVLLPSPVATAGPVAPKGFPAEIADLPLAGPSLPADVTEAVVIRQPDGDTPLTVEFPTVALFGGSYAYAQAAVRGDAFTVQVPPRPADWGDTIVGDDEVITPSYRVALPLTEALVHTEISLTASMDLTYPRSSFLDTLDRNRRTFVEETEPVAREFRLFVATRADLEFQRELDAWRARQRSAGQGVDPAVVRGAGVFALLLTMIGALRIFRSRGMGTLPTRLAKAGIVVREQVAFRSGVRSSVVVDAPPAGTPAERAGVRSGDVLFRIDAVPPVGGRRTERRLRRAQRTGVPHRMLLFRDGQVVSTELRIRPGARPGRDDTAAHP